MSQTNVFCGRNRWIRHLVGFAFFALAVFSGSSGAQTWVPATPFEGSGAGTAILRTDGSVLVQELSAPASQGGTATGNWYILDPDENGFYSTGTWHFLAPPPFAYAPLYFASAVLPDGRIMMEGGEFEFSTRAETNQGAILDQNNIFTAVAPPSGWTQIGDAQSVILAGNT